MVRRENGSYEIEEEMRRLIEADERERQREIEAEREKQLANERDRETIQS